MIDPRTRALLVTIRAALIMMSKAIEKYLGEQIAESVKMGETDTVTAT